MNNSEFTKQCKLCGAEMPKRSKVCNQCGATQRLIMTAKLNPCRVCKTQISTDVKKCPHCGAVPTNRIIAYTAIACVITLFVALIVVAINSNTEPTTNLDPNETAETNTTNMAEEIVYANVVDMLNEYEENEVAADLKYKGKTVVISGIISEIGKTESLFGDGTPYILFSNSGANGYFSTVQCGFSKKTEIEKLANCSKGQSVTIKGTCTGFSLLNVIMSNCFIVE